MDLKTNGNGIRKVRIITFIAFLGIIALMINILMPGDPYDIKRYFSKEEQDTLITNIVTYMGVKPQNADWKIRHEAHYRQFYVQQAQSFSFYKYFVAEDGFHYFYIIRQVRNPLGNHRAIGGRYKVDEHLNLFEYEELFITHTLEEDYLREIAPDLFRALINNNLGKYLNNRLIIEWPDDRADDNRKK